MREIKFRAWDKKYKAMASFELMQTNARFAIDAPLPSGQFVVLPRHENIVLMQFTGLKDKNGKEIYEGDILLDDTEGETYDCVEWNSFNGGFDTKYWYSPRELVENAESHEIIGNIYENPELLDSNN